MKKRFWVRYSLILWLVAGEFHITSYLNRFVFTVKFSPEWIEQENSTSDQGRIRSHFYKKSNPKCFFDKEIPVEPFKAMNIRLYLDGLLFTHSIGDLSLLESKKNCQRPDNFTDCYAGENHRECQQYQNHGRFEYPCSYFPHRKNSRIKNVPREIRTEMINQTKRIIFKILPNDGGSIFFDFCLICRSRKYIVAAPVSNKRAPMIINIIIGLRVKKGQIA